MEAGGATTAAPAATGRAHAPDATTHKTSPNKIRLTHLFIGSRHVAVELARDEIVRPLGCRDVHPLSTRRDVGFLRVDHIFALGPGLANDRSVRPNYGSGTHSDRTQSPASGSDRSATQCAVAGTSHTVRIGSESSSFESMATACR